MPGSSFVFFDKISALTAKVAAPIAKGASASLDDTASGISVAIPASIDDPAVKGKAFAGLIQEKELEAFKNVLKSAVRNRLVILPAAVALNAVLPGALPYVLGIGGSFLAYEAGETVLHSVAGYFGKNKETHHDDENASKNEILTPEEFQQKMERGFKQTDIIMTSEVTGISMGSMHSTSVLGQLTSLAATSAAVSVGVFGLVFGIIRADNLAMHLQEKKGNAWWAKTQRAVGDNIMKVVPAALKGISYIGTSAMFWIGGQLVTEAVPKLEHMSEHVSHGSGPLSLAFSAAVGLGVGATLASSHRVLGPYIDEPVGKAAKAIKSVFNSVGARILNRKPKTETGIKNDAMVQPVEPNHP